MAILGSSQSSHLDASDESRPQANVEMSLKLVDARNNVIACRLALKNVERARINAALLPWENHYSVLWTAMTPNRHLLKRRLPIDDPRIEWRELVKDVPVDGTIDLADHFVDLDQTRRKSDVFIFWTYRPSFKDTLSSEWIGGWLLLPKLAS